MYTYVVSDIHNNWLVFSKILKFIKFNKDDCLVINGDLIDKGDEIKPFIKFLKENSNVVYILGNHEQMFIDAYETGNLYKKDISCDICNQWFYNGGEITFNSLSENEITWLYNYYKMKCSYFKFINNSIFVHGGLGVLNKNNSISELLNVISSMDINKLIWDNEFFLEYCVHKRIIDFTLPSDVFIGHNSMMNINLDAMVVICTRLKNDKKIIVTDMSDSSGRDKSMLFYCMETEIFYIARKGIVSTYISDNTKQGELVLKDFLFYYPYMNRYERRLFEKYNRRNNPMSEEDYWEQFIR